MNSRTCVICRAKKSPLELYRFTLKDGKPVQDVDGKGHGRGAYCCTNETCYAAFVQNEKRWKRAFRL